MVIKKLRLILPKVKVSTTMEDVANVAIMGLNDVYLSLSWILDLVRTRNTSNVTGEDSRTSPGGSMTSTTDIIETTCANLSGDSSPVNAKEHYNFWKQVSELYPVPCWQPFWEANGFQGHYLIHFSFEIFQHSYYE